MRTLPRRRSTLKVVALSLLACLTLLTAVPLFADEPSKPQAVAIGVGILVMLVIFAAAYVYFSLALQTIGTKTNTENPWLAWIPIVNIILMLNIAKKPLWWIVLCFIPLINAIFMVIIWMGIAEAVKKPSWWGIMMIVPVINLIVPGYLAWAD
jgi:magnesium-transporting ATPase (P-type)